MDQTLTTEFLTKEDEYRKMKSSQGVTLINFGVPWAMGCNIQNSITGKVAKIFKDDVNFCNVDIENVPKAKEDFHVHNVPTIVILDHGNEVKRFEGVQPEKTIAKELNSVTRSFEMDKKEVEALWEEMMDRETEKELLHKQIMLVDDDPDLTFCVRTILEEARFDNIVIASDHQGAVEHIRKHVPDLIFLNLNMHNKDGNRIMMTLRRNKEWNTIPLLVTVGPVEPTRVYEDSFKDAAILKHGKYVEHPSTRDSFIGLVRHMLLYGEHNTESQMLSVGNICPPDRKSL